MRRVRLKVDLTKYGDKFKNGAEGTSSLIEFKHSNIWWTYCVNINIDGSVLPVTMESIEILEEVLEESMDFYTIEKRIQEREYYMALDVVKLKADIIQAIIDETAMTEAQANFIYDEVAPYSATYDINQIRMEAYRMRKFLNLEDKK